MNLYSIEQRRPGYGFTLIELLVGIAVISVLCLLTATATSKVRSAADKTACASNLRQAGAAALLFAQENNSRLFYYRETLPDGTLWYFGLENGKGGSEGSRSLDLQKGPLSPYMNSEEGLGICPAFSYDDPLWKAKFDGPSTNYGFNVLLSGANILKIKKPSQVVLFGDSAQVNTFQAPASPSNPMLEEFYIIDNQSAAVHFRHNDLAQFVFMDGHVEALPMEPGTGDSRIEETKVGRITPRWSKKYLE